jgi:hypothetical protein
MKHHKKFASQEQQQVSEVQARQKVDHEFASVEELLRFDVKQTTIPSEVVRRLNRSLQKEPAVPRPWWRQWLGKR